MKTLTLKIKRPDGSDSGQTEQRQISDVEAVRMKWTERGHIINGDVAILLAEIDRLNAQLTKKVNG